MLYKKLLHYISFIFKIDCIGCGSLLPHRSGLCEKCFKQLNTYKIVTDSKENIKSLYSWRPQVSDLISSYVYFLKSPFSYSAWTVMSEEFVKMLAQKNNNKKTLLVPIPSSTGRNHSLYFTKNLSKMTNLPHKQVLSYGKANPVTLSQKHKTKIQRTEQSFVIDEKFTDRLRSYQCIIFVDDIITTGATYSAAQQAVRKLLDANSDIKCVQPDMQFFLWTGFKREKIETRC